MIVFAVLRSTLDKIHLDFTVSDKVRKKNSDLGTLPAKECENRAPGLNTTYFIEEKLHVAPLPFYVV